MPATVVRTVAWTKPAVTSLYWLAPAVIDTSPSEKGTKFAPTPNRARSRVASKWLSRVIFSEKP